MIVVDRLKLVKELHIGGHPTAVALDMTGENVLVTNWEHKCIERIRLSDSADLGRITHPCFCSLWGVAVDYSTGTMFVSDSRFHCIHVFDSVTGKFIRQ